MGQDKVTEAETLVEAAIRLMRPRIRLLRPGKGCLGQDKVAEAGIRLLGPG